MGKNVETEQCNSNYVEIYIYNDVNFIQIQSW